METLTELPYEGNIHLGIEFNRAEIELDSTTPKRTDALHPRFVLHVFIQIYHLHLYSTLPMHVYQSHVFEKRFPQRFYEANTYNDKIT